MRRNLEDRFNERYIPEPNSGCWIWLYCLDANGYGRVSVLGSSRLAHRISYEVERGPIPDGLTLDHLCRVRHCVNPSHLEPVPMRENVMRGEGFGAKNALKTHCPKGHEYDYVNTYVYRGANGTRRLCRTCAPNRSLLKPLAAIS